ncbi:hypothetical protein [Anaerophilus nitritogenes]|uniref:hypothetical protein n=1 Tax=Anaerophilus nitritogenes TaxID=2498136 RepID=UPI00101D01F4|nr:hypothetical protein [Anaerophilus nitritogenes]
MKNDEKLNSEIKKVLFKRVEDIQPKTGDFHLIKERLSRKEGNKEMMKRYYDKICYKMRRPIASVCCAALMLALLCTFNPSVRAWAQESIQKIYVVVKGEDGTYQTKQTEAKIEQGPKIKVLEDKDIGFKYKAPNTIGKNYTSDEVISGDASGNSHSLFYRNGDSAFVLNMTNEDWLMYCAKASKDNNKELNMEGITVYYFEEGRGDYPMIQDSNGNWTQDFTQPPTKIKTVHKFTWEYEGITYELSDLGNTISNDVMEQAVEDIIKYQMGK